MPWIIQRTYYNPEAANYAEPVRVDHVPAGTKYWLKYDSCKSACYRWNEKNRPQPSKGKIHNVNLRCQE